MWFLAACYAKMGRLDEARGFAARHSIGLDVQWFKFASMFGTAERREFLISGLRLATGEPA
jgi:hypothetical protein